MTLALFQGRLPVSPSIVHRFILRLRLGDDLQLKSNKAWQEVSWAKFNNQDNFVEVSVHILG